MHGRRRALSSWRVAIPLAMSLLVPGTGVPGRAQGVAGGAGSGAVRQVCPAVAVGTAVVADRDGVRDELQRDGVDMAVPRAVHGRRQVRPSLAGARRLAWTAAAGTTDGAVLSRMSRSLARWKEGEWL
jgi:hypothetical protein